MKPHIRYIVEGQIIGSALIAQGIVIDKDGNRIDGRFYYSYTTEQTDQGPVTIISKTNTFQKA